jgi:hypothetical protein
MKFQGSLARCFCATASRAKRKRGTARVLARTIHSQDAGCLDGQFLVAQNAPPRREGERFRAALAPTPLALILTRE